MKFRLAPSLDRLVIPLALAVAFLAALGYATGLDLGHAIAVLFGGGMPATFIGQARKRNQILGSIPNDAGTNTPRRMDLRKRPTWMSPCSRAVCSVTSAHVSICATSRRGCAGTSTSAAPEPRG